MAAPLRENAADHISMQVAMLAKMVKAMRMSMYGMAPHLGSRAMADNPRP